VVAIFTRELTDDLTSLVKWIDGMVGKNQGEKMAAFVVLLSDDPDADEKRLKALAAKEKIVNTPLTVLEGVAGPPKYKLAKDAEVTVLMWTGKACDVKVNHAFRKGELKADAIRNVVLDSFEILGKKKGLQLKKT